MRKRPLPKRLMITSAILCCSSFATFSQAVSGAMAPNSPIVKTLIDSSSRAEVFAPGAASTPYDEWATSFTPDGNTVYVSQGGVFWTIVYSKKTGGQWGTPKVAPFSGRWNDTDPFISPDGNRLFFISNRPLVDTPQDKPQKDYHIWYVDHLSGDDWSAPHHLEAPINIEGVNNYAPSVSRSGTLCFCSRGRDGHEGMTSYAAAWRNGAYDKPVPLALLGKEDMQDPFIAPDESYLVFVSGNDLYISFRQGNDWSTAQKLPLQVNNGDSNSSPYVSRDGKTLYYSSGRIQGFYKRDRSHALDYDGLVKEMQNIFNGHSNILMIPIKIPADM